MNADERHQKWLKEFTNGYNGYELMPLEKILALEPSYNNNYKNVVVEGIVLEKEILHEQNCKVYIVLGNPSEEPENGMKIVLESRSDKNAALAKDGDSFSAAGAYSIEDMMLYTHKTFNKSLTKRMLNEGER